jgi:hypothetical protein
MWALVDEYIPSYLRLPSTLMAAHRLENHHAHLEDKIDDLHKQGSEAWKQACERYFETGAGFLPEDGGYERLMNLRCTFLEVEQQLLEPERPISERYRLAQSLTLMAEVFEMVRALVCI